MQIVVQEGLQIENGSIQLSSLLTKRSLSVKIAFLKSDLFKTQLHDLVDSCRPNVGHCQSTTEPVKHCSNELAIPLVLRLDEVRQHVLVSPAGGSIV